VAGSEFTTGFCLSRAILAVTRINSVSLQCEVIAYRPEACAELARDYWRFDVSRPAAQESQVSQCQQQRRSHFWGGSLVIADDGKNLCYNAFMQSR
jgi:hypothetical protein